jgi:hypothetical protein
MSKYTDTMSQWADEHATLMAGAKKLAVDAIEEPVDQLKKNSMDSIPAQFGEFLYTVMGDRVTGQRSSTLNTTFLENHSEGQALVAAATNNGCTVEEESKKRQKEYWDAYGKRVNSYERDNQPDIFITVGRKFGISHVTGKGDRVHTRYFEPNECFSGLTQLHVGCIKNRQKRECAQDFLTYRDNFVTEATELNNIIVPTPLTAKMLKQANISVYSEGDRYNAKNFQVIEEEYEANISHTMAMIQNYQVWDMKGSLPRVNTSGSFISLTFLDINDDTNIIGVGNLDISMVDVVHPFVTDSYGQKRNHTQYMENSNHQYNGYPAINQQYNGRKVHDNDDTLMNLGEIIADTEVKKLLDERIKFYNDQSSKLQELKHNHATLYFLHGDI